MICNYFQFFLLPGKKFCLTFSATLSHDDLSLLNAADDDLLEFLERFQSWGSNDTLLFVMGDHGTRCVFVYHFVISINFLHYVLQQYVSISF